MQGLTKLCLALASVVAVSHASVNVATPMEEVVTLLQDMNTKIQESGKAEQASYDKYSCWCEETLAQKAKYITEAKNMIEEFQTEIIKNKGLIGAGVATVAKLKKDMTDNTEAQKEAAEVRAKENAGYRQEKDSAESSIAAMENAITVLTKATAAKGTKFLENLQEAKILSAAAGLRPIMQTAAAKTMKSADLEVWEKFMDKPQDFLKGQSALQTEHNPYGDFAPQSTQIQGILKGMYESFVIDLEKDNGEEADRQQAFQALTATKVEEYDSMALILRTETTDLAEAQRLAAVAKGERDDSQASLKGAEEFFRLNQDSCQAKANQWADRSRLRSQEVASINQAITILTSDDAKKTFKSATENKKDDAPTFAQISAVVHHHPREEAYKRLKAVASSSNHHDLQLAQIAIAAKTGHFDDVIAKVDKMIGVLRAEAADDMGHRDRCEGKQNENKNNLADAEKGIAKSEAEMLRIDGEMDQRKADIVIIKADIVRTNQTIKDIAVQRTSEVAAYKVAKKDDEAAIALMEKAKATLANFYKGGASALQVHQEPAKAAPNTNFDSTPQTGQANNVVAILDMIIDDLGAELKSSAKAELDAQAAYVVSVKSLKESLRALNEAKTAAVSELAVLNTDRQDASQNKLKSEKDKNDEDALKIAINTDCAWVAAQFGPRETARKAEMAGLVQAREFLAGVGADDDFSFSEDNQ